MTVFICGFSGSGKSWLYEKVSKDCQGCQCVDLDDYLFQKYGGGYDALGSMIEKIGFDKFRELERSAVVQDFLSKTNILCFLGGGALENLSQGEIKSLKENGDLLVHLDASFEQCWQRISNDSNRPLVKLGKDKLEEIYKHRAKKFQMAQITLSQAQLNTIAGLSDLKKFLNLA